MKRLGIAGWSGAGKTTLLDRLIPLLVARGLSVSTIKHAHHEFDIDEPGKDSYRHRAAGAMEVMLAAEKRWVLMHEHRSAPEAELDDLLARMTPVDLVLVEGFRDAPHDKLEVYRSDSGRPLLAPDDPHIVAVASDVPLDGLAVPVLPLDDVDGLAAFVLRHCGLDR
jgi:molybdopterin-guanine dinucleotide biosynthesis protein MobB